MAPISNRQMIHRRNIECVGYRRDDGLWDIEGRITDTKGYAHSTREKVVEAGKPFHDMVLRLTIDNEFLILDSVAITEASPYQYCMDAVSYYHKLIGLRIIGADFFHKVRELFRGTGGCTHITDLIGPVATTAIQTIFGWRYQQDPEAHHGSFAKHMVNSCHGFRDDGELVKRYFPDSYAE